MSDDCITLYFSSVSSNAELKHNQKRIMDILESKKIEFRKIDISADTESKDEMRKIVNDPTALPPQLCKGDVYLGDFKAFDEALEDKDLETFLQINA